ncbi:MAG: hypothetical protein ILP17_08985 [Lachnospiraceae bacterium]|nr:hypothetical protein [Lachnospiraceae bacterium]
MTPISDHKEWSIARDDLIYSITSLGFPEELGYEIAKNLGSPKAMRRMNAYLRQVRPGSAELVVDEMLAIRAEIDSWRERKEAQEANARYNEMRYYGLIDKEDE